MSFLISLKNVHKNEHDENEKNVLGNFKIISNWVMVLKLRLLSFSSHLTDQIITPKI